MEKVSDVKGVQLTLLAGDPPAVKIVAYGWTSSTDWTEPTLEPLNAQMPPEDGLYNFELKATRPSGPAGQAMTLVAAEYTMNLTDDFIGVLVHSASNTMEKRL